MRREDFWDSIHSFDAAIMVDYAATSISNLQPSATFSELPSPPRTPRVLNDVGSRSSIRDTEDRVFTAKMSKTQKLLLC